MWPTVQPKDKVPYEQKASKLKEKYEKEIAAYHGKCKGETGQFSMANPSKEEEEDEDEEEDDEEEEDDDEDDE
ncbi:hypothetical protein scyTo_0010248 [Scyliorhinus torazame]|uniref:HMG box domain-containing protein n=1 Tax=Scyliorhinus torazame TaxID=75743 RepID=A0A401P2V0_SCYTO|nr:hypothetical protein [Scyliorhinus torazame]